MHDQTDQEQPMDTQEAQLEVMQAEADLLALVDQPKEAPPADGPLADEPPAEADAGRGVTIGEMSAAPEADDHVRDADAPAWAPAAEGHGSGPLDAVDGAPGTDRTAPAAMSAAEATAPAATPGVRVKGDTVEVRQTGAERIEGREVSIVQGGAAIIRGDKVRIEQGGAFAIVGRRIDLRDSGAFILLARRTSGEVHVAFDWRAIAAIVMGIIAIMVVRGRR